MFLPAKFGVKYRVVAPERRANPPERTENFGLAERIGTNRNESERIGTNRNESERIGTNRNESERIGDSGTVRSIVKKNFPDFTALYGEIFRCFRAKFNT
jgi:hypothetical protein